MLPVYVTGNMIPERRQASDYQRTFRQRMTAMGLVRKDAWILPEHSLTLAHVLKALRVKGSRIHIEEGQETMEQKNVTAQSLYGVLAEQFKGKSVEVTLSAGVDPVVVCKMGDHGDLPIIVAASGDVIIAQATLWPESQVKDTAVFNREVMLNEKLFGLANISLDRFADGQIHYVAYGALRAQSTGEDLAYEIEALAHSVIDIAETFQSHLQR